MTLRPLWFTTREYTEYMKSKTNGGLNHLNSEGYFSSEKKIISEYKTFFVLCVYNYYDN